MATRIDRSFPEVVLASGTTITVTLDDVNGRVTKLNVYGTSPAVSHAEPIVLLPPVLAHEPGGKEAPGLSP